MLGGYTLSNVNVFGGSVFVDNLHGDIPFQLVKELLTVFPVVILPAVGAAYHHHDVIVVVEVDLFVAHRWAKQVTVFFHPLHQVEWFGYGHIAGCF